jgi:hypothetical protein
MTDMTDAGSIDVGTLILAIGFDGYLLALALVARADIARFGRGMVAGVALGFAALIFGEITVLGEAERFGAAMAAASLISLTLITRALWTRRHLLAEPLPSAEDPVDHSSYYGAPRQQK